jgi:hypothetical protein
LKGTITWLFMYCLGSIKFLVSEKNHLFIFLYGLMLKLCTVVVAILEFQSKMSTNILELHIRNIPTMSKLHHTCDFWEVFLCFFFYINQSEIKIALTAMLKFWKKQKSQLKYKTIQETFTSFHRKGLKCEKPNCIPVPQLVQNDENNSIT